MGCKVVSKEEFKCYHKNIVVIGANESAKFQNKYWFYNEGTPLFTSDVSKLFDDIDSPQIIDVFQSQKDEVPLKHMKNNAKGQPVLVDFNYSIQNCAIKMPKLSLTPQRIK
eukprot:8058231-Ditylum_brightwellii.AAC.1